MWAPAEPEDEECADRGGIELRLSVHPREQSVELGGEQKVAAPLGVEERLLAEPVPHEDQLLLPGVQSAKV
jgi:hypothetical protein